MISELKVTCFRLESKMAFLLCLLRSRALCSPLAKGSSPWARSKEGLASPPWWCLKPPFKSEGGDGCSPWGARSGLRGPVHTRERLTASLVVSCPVRDSVWETLEGFPPPSVASPLSHRTFKRRVVLDYRALESRPDFTPCHSWQGYLVVSQGFWMALCMYDLILS